MFLIILANSLFRKEMRFTKSMYESLSNSDILDEILINEIAPRVHNSGHLTLNAFTISQFENHVRAVCDLKFEKSQKKIKCRND